MARKTERDAKFPEIMHVFGGDDLVGSVCRVEELGIIEWEASTPDDRVIGRFGGRGSKQKAVSAVLQEAELEV